MAREPYRTAEDAALAYPSMRKREQLAVERQMSQTYGLTRSDVRKRLAEFAKRVPLVAQAPAKPLAATGLVEPTSEVQAFERQPLTLSRTGGGPGSARPPSVRLVAIQQDATTGALTQIVVDAYGEVV